MVQSRFLPLVLAIALALPHTAAAQPSAAGAGGAESQTVVVAQEASPVVEETAAPGGSGDIAKGAGLGLLAGLVILAIIVGSGG
jgi:hypothetical protein